MTFPTVRPSRVQFPPPVPTSGVTDPGGKTPAEQTHRLQTEVAKQYQVWRDAHSPDIDPDILKANAGAFAQAPAMAQLGPALKAVEQDADQAGRKVADTVSNTRVAPEQEARANRVWQNAVRVLDGKSSQSQIVSAARDLIANAGDDLPVFVESLGPYLESRNVPTGWLPAAYAEAIPGLSDAVDDAAVKTKQLAMVRSNYQRLTNAVAKDLAAPQLLDPSTVTAAPYTNPAGDGDE
jgi:hypothetical protein